MGSIIELLAPGSSLGGTRPKASVRDKDGHLAIWRLSPDFDINHIQARKIMKEVGFATALWREEAAKLKIKKSEIN